MKIVLKQEVVQTKVYDDDGDDITALLGVTAVDVHCNANGLLQVQLTVLPSELVVETEDGKIKLVKSPLYNELKK